MRLMCGMMCLRTEGGQRVERCQVLQLDDSLDCWGSFLWLRASERFSVLDSRESLLAWWSFSSVI